ncbi:MAG: arginine decarboxylase, partial [Nevskiaceae bacterium]
DSPPAAAPAPAAAGDPPLLHDLQATLEAIGERPALECLHDARHFLAEAQAAYTAGALTVGQRARVEQGYYAVCRAVAPRLDPAVRAHREALDELREKLAEKYFCNFSVFQSVPDVWGIDQVFPIMPIHRLDERPALRATLCDLTCDSDGRIEQYVDRGGVETTLPLHPLKTGEPYLLGIFMVGAYQEILGDMHNLFGDTNAVNVVLDGQGGWKLEDAEKGDRTDELLRYVHLEPEELKTAYARKLDAAKLPAAERARLQAELEAGLTGYTYLT